MKKKRRFLWLALCSVGIQACLCTAQFLRQYAKEVDGILCPIKMGFPGVFLAFYPIYNGGFIGWQYMFHLLHLILDCAILFGLIWLAKKAWDRATHISRGQVTK